MLWTIFLLFPEKPWISNPLPPGGTRVDYFWVKALGPPAQLLLCPEDPLLQSLVEGPQELASGQHMVTNSLGREERRHRVLRVESRHLADIKNST